MLLVPWDLCPQPLLQIAERLRNPAESFAGSFWSVSANDSPEHPSRLHVFLPSHICRQHMFSSYVPAFLPVPAPGIGKCQPHYNWGKIPRVGNTVVYGIQSRNFHTEHRLPLTTETRHMTARHTLKSGWLWGSKVTSCQCCPLGFPAYSGFPGLSSFA